MVIQPNAVETGTGLYCLLQALVNRVFNNPLLAAATTNTRVKNTNAFTFAVEGVLISKAATDPLDDFDAAFVNTGAGQVCHVRLEMNAAGALSGIQGPIITATDIAPALVPRRTASKATLGTIQIPASFVFGTTSYGTAVFVQGDPDLGTGRGTGVQDRGIAATIVNAP
jgi:hypothetical protein